MVEHPFLKLLKDGKIEFTKEGFIVPLHEGDILLPSRVFNKLLLLLLKEDPKFGIKILKEIGRYQVEQAVKRYMKIWQIHKMPTDDLIIKFIDMLTFIGVGKPKIEEMNKNLNKVNIKKQSLLMNIDLNMELLKFQ